MRSFVDVTLIEGDMGCGKTTTGVATIVDKVKEDPTLKVFSNVHLFGIKYIYNPDIEATIRLLKNPIFNHAIWLIDETVAEADSRRSSSNRNLIYSWIVQSLRKRDIYLIWVIQDSRMTEWRIKKVVTRWIECLEYDWDDDTQKGTRKIKCTIKKLRHGKPLTEKTVRYWAPQYWPYFQTDELHDLPIYECACGCGHFVMKAGAYIQGHRSAMKEREKELALEAADAD